MQCSTRNDLIQLCVRKRSAEAGKKKSLDEERESNLYERTVSKKDRDDLTSTLT